MTRVIVGDWKQHHAAHLEAAMEEVDPAELARIDLTQDPVMGIFRGIRREALAKPYSDRRLAEMGLIPVSWLPSSMSWTDHGG
jgi:hypothetical protein